MNVRNLQGVLHSFSIKNNFIIKLTYDFFFLEKKGGSRNFEVKIKIS